MIDKPLKNDEPDNITLADTIADINAISAVEVMEQEDEYRILHEAVDGLKPPMNDVINAYYFEDKSLKEIGNNMGVSAERARQIKANALRTLRSSPALMQMYRENRQHEAINSLQRYRTRPDMHLYILELERNHAEILRRFNLNPPV